MLKEGTLSKKGNLGWQKRWFEITRRTLVYKAKKDAKQNKAVISLNEAVIEPVDAATAGKPFAFAVKTSSREMLLRAETEEEYNGWLELLRQVRRARAHSCKRDNG